MAPERREPPRVGAKVAIGLAVLTLVASVGAVAIAQPDVHVYERYADTLLKGPASAGLPKEYPALAGLVFSGVALLPGPYWFDFSLCMALALTTLVLFGVRRSRDSGWAERVLLYLVLAASAVIFARYDLLPAACELAAVIWVSEGRFGRAWGAAALGTALKLFPALLLPGFFLYEWRSTGRLPARRVLATALGAGVVAVTQAWLAPGTLLSPFRYELRRGFEFSSVGGSLTFLSDPFHASWHYAYGAWEISGGSSTSVRIVISLAELGAFALVWWLLGRRHLTVQAASLAVLSVAVLCDHALAPQYLIWLAPLWALWPLRRSWLVAALLTSLVFPIAFQAFPSLTVATVVAVLRNTVLIVGTVLWFRSELRSGRPRNWAPVEICAEKAVLS